MKLVKVSTNGIYILDEKIKSKINNLLLSPSTINSWISSPGDFVLNKYILPLVQEQDVTHLKRGNWFHEIMEDFFKKPGKERTIQELLLSAKAITSKEDYLEFSKDLENQAWIKRALQRYSDNWIEEAPKQKIAKLFVNGSSQEGLELKLRCKLPNIERTCYGAIDQLIEGDMGLIINDWKTGKKVSNYNPSLKESTSNPFDYWRQQTFYALLLETFNARVEKAYLTFPCSEPATVVEVDQNNPKIRERVLQEVAQVEKEIQEAIDKDYFFEFRKGPYNGWASWLGGLGSARKPDILEDEFLNIAEIE